MRSLFSLGSSFLARLGRLQLFLTGLAWLHGIAGWVYLFWYGSLVATAVLAAPCLEARFGSGAAAGVQFAGSVIVYFLALGLVVLCFQRDSEEDSARTGMLVGRGEFVDALFEGEESDPRLRLISPFKKRLGWVTMGAGGLGMTLAFALLCQGLNHAGLTAWFDTHGLGGRQAFFADWVMFSLVNVFRALDIFDTLWTFGIAPPIIHHQGWWASAGVFAFKGVFDFLLLAKLRVLLEQWSIFKRVQERTMQTAAEMRVMVRRNLSATLQRTGDTFVPRYIRRYVTNRKVTQDVRVFAHEIAAGSGLKGRVLLGLDLLEQLEKAPSADVTDRLGRLHIFGGDVVNFVRRGRKPAVQPLPNPGTEPGPVWANGLGMEFIWCPPGEFTMGEVDEAHGVTLTRGFWIGKYPLTQAQWEAVVGFNPTNVKGVSTQAPVVGVSWYDARGWLLGLSIRELKAGNLPEGWEYSLPTEAQWEYACRAGSTTAWCFGDDEAQLVDYAWYRDNSESKTHPVGQKKPNAWGLYDMHGNVWEWCQDAYANYDVTKREDPTGPALMASSRVYRGGCWNRDAFRCQSADRDRNKPNGRGGILGFRPVLFLRG